MIGTRFAKLEVSAEVEAREQCEAAKQLTVDMVVAGAEGAYNRTAGIGTQLAEAEFFRQVSSSITALLLASGSMTWFPWT